MALDESKSAFEPENLGPVILIMLMRLYDIQLAFLSTINPGMADQLAELHEQGHSFAPQPKFIEYGESEDDDGDTSN